MIEVCKKFGVLQEFVFMFLFVGLYFLISFILLQLSRLYKNK